MSDDDSDDSILGQAVFRKRRVSSRNNKADDAGAFLESLVKNRQADTITSMQVARLEKETTATSSLSTTEPRRPIKRERHATHDPSTGTTTTGTSLGGSGTVLSKPTPSLWETQPTLFLASLVSSPSSASSSTGMLQLPSTLKLARKQLKAKIGAARGGHDSTGILSFSDDDNWDLLSPRVRGRLLQLQKSVPADLAEYCLQLTCSTDTIMQGMAMGASDLLQDSSFTISISAMKLQLEQCWGLIIPSPDLATTTGTIVRPEKGTLYNTQNAAVAMTRWLHLWDMILRRQLVTRITATHDKNEQVKANHDEIMKCILLLIHAACDPLLDDASHASVLQRVLAYLLGMAESTADNSAQVVNSLMERLGDKWLNFGIGIMHLVAPVIVPSGQPTQQFRFEICQALLESLFPSPFDLSLVLDRWNWTDKASNLPAKMLALSFVALQQLRPMVIKGEPYGPLALAVIELALCLLQMGLPTARPSYPLRQPFHEYCQVLQDLADKSNAWVLQDINFLRFHYYLLCFKQVPRLEVPIQNSLQPSLDTFFVSSQANEQ